MTLTLILMRHAKSSWDDPDCDDHERRLNPRGQQATLRMGHWLRTHGLIPDVAVSSSSVRTRETFAGLGFDCEVAFTVQLYHARAHTMLSALTILNAKTVLMIGHNPGIADFARRIVSRPPPHPKFEAYPSCATLIVRFDAPNWRNITWGQGTPVDFGVPRDMADP